MSNTPGLIWTISFFLLALAPLVFVHELGHYLVARWCGVKSEVFAIGFGPRLFGWKDSKGTDWRICLLPLGGYVRFKGDMNPASMADPEWVNLPEEEKVVSFPAQSLWKKAAIVAAGPITNFIFAILILAGFAAAYGQSVTPTVIDVVTEKSPAASAGLLAGDKLLSINGRTVETFDEVTAIIQDRPKAALDFVYERKGETRNVTITTSEVVERDRFGNEYRLGRVGIGVERIERVPVSLLEAPLVGISETISIVDRMISGLWQILSGRKPVEELGGPIKIAQISGQVATMGWESFAYFLALISINLGFINLLPVPMLDGGHLTFYAIEAIRRKPVSEQAMELAFKSGLFMVLGLMVFVTINDLASLGVWTKLSNLFG